MFGLTIQYEYLGKSSFNSNQKTQCFVWLVKLSREGREFIFKFRKGLAHVGRKVGDSWKMATQNELLYDENRLIKQNHPIPPYLDEVLECLQMDVIDFQNNVSYKEWSDNYGYNPDSIKGKKVFRKCRKYARKMRKLLCAEWDNFLNHRFDED